MADKEKRYRLICNRDFRSWMVLCILGKHIGKSSGREETLMGHAFLATMPLTRAPFRRADSQRRSVEPDMPLQEYKRWVDAMVSRPESLEKARRHAPGKTLKRKSA